MVAKNVCLILSCMLALGLSGVTVSELGKSGEEERGITAANNTLCVYCGSKNFGAGCPHSPDKKHRHGADGLHCIWCGSTNYGKGCPHAPDRTHVRG